MDGYANAHLLISADELAKATGGAASGPLLVLDLRPADAYAAGHIPAAVHLDLFGLSLIDTDPAPLKAFMWMIEHVLASRGVEAATPVVVYDEQSGIRAARAFWFLEYLRASLGQDSRRRLRRLDQWCVSGDARRRASGSLDVDGEARTGGDRDLARRAIGSSSAEHGDSGHAE